MTVFAVEYTYTADKAPVRDDRRAAHREWLGRLLTDGALLASGPFPDGSGALLLFSVADETVMAHLLTQDPLHSVGAVAATRIVEWNPVIGPFTSV